MIRHVAIGAVGALTIGLTACSLSTPETSAQAGGANSLRSVTTFRQWHGESRLDTKIRLVGGSLRITAGPRNELYRLTSAYNRNQAVPDGMYNAEQGRLEIGRRAGDVDPGGDTISTTDEITIKIGGGDDDDGAAASTLALSPAVATTLGIDLVGTTGDVELGNLQTSLLHINTVAGETSVRFSQPNAAVCIGLVVNAVLSDLSLTGLGNSHCQTLDISGTAAHVKLDFSGSWPANTTMQSKIVAGSLEIRVPRDVGVRISRKEKVLANLATPGMVQDGDALVSPNYASAERRLDIDATAMIGGISLERID